MRQPVNRIIAINPESPMRHTNPRTAYAGRTTWWHLEVAASDRDGAVAPGNGYSERVENVADRPLTPVPVNLWCSCHPRRVCCRWAS